MLLTKKVKPLLGSFRYRIEGFKQNFVTHYWFYYSLSLGHWARLPFFDVSYSRKKYVKNYTSEPRIIK